LIVTKDYCNSEESIKYEDIINSIFGIYIRNFLYQINYNIDREFPGCFEKIVIYSLYQIYILIFDYFSKDYPTFQQFIFNYKGKVIIKKDLINYFVDKDIPDFKEKLEITNYTEYLIKIVNFYFDRNPNVLIDNIEKKSEYFFKVAKKEFKKKGFYYIIGNNNNIFDIKEIWDSICNFKILLNKVDNYIYNKCNLGNMEFQQDYTSNTEMLSFYIQNYENISKIITGIQKDIKLMKKSHYSIKLVDLIETIHEIWNEKNIFDKDKINEILKNLSMINSSNENKRESFIKYMNFKSTDVYNVLYRFYNDFIISSIPLNPLINESNIELLNKILLKIENIPGFNKLGIIVPQNKIDEQINESKNKIDILNNN
jgi:hypothetical protein